MKKNSGYMTRALQAKDPRFATILDKLGYTPREDQEDEEPKKAAPKKKAPAKRKPRKKAKK